MQIKMDENHTIFTPFFKGELFVGFSGGADSTAALLLALQFRDASECRVTAVHFNHHLRGAESDREARDAEEFAAKHGADFRLFDLDVPRNAGSLEAAARKERLRVWHSLAANRPRTAVVLGHHADDRTENFFLRLIRGSNASGLSAPSERSELAGITFLRPLWSWSRRDVEDFLREQHVGSWAVDSSNLICNCRRNLLRQKFLPQFYDAFPEARTGIRASLDALAMDAAFLDATAMEKLSAGNPEKTDFWRSLPPPLLVRALRFWQKQQLGDDSPFSGDAVRRFQMSIRKEDSPAPRSVPLGQNRKILLQNGLLHWVRPVPPDLIWNRSEGPCQWGNWTFSAEIAPDGSCSGKPDEEFFDPEKLPQQLRITAIRPGDRMIPFGCQYEVKVKKLRVNSKHPAAEILPVLRTPDYSPIWIPGVRRAAIAPVHGKSCRIRASRIHPE